MINLELTEEHLDELYKEATENSCARARKKCWVVYLKGKGHAHQEISDVMRVEGHRHGIFEEVSRWRSARAVGRARP